MKFIYQFRTPDNVLHSGVIRAASREAVYSALKLRGVKPSRVDDAPGLLNCLLGKGKRWCLIVFLATIVIVSAFLIAGLRREVSEMHDGELMEERSQLYGDPVVIGECESVGWTNVFKTAFECYLAGYAIPGKVVERRQPFLRQDVRLDIEPVREDELLEIAQMRRMVNGMKKELSEYLTAGGTVEGYIKRLDIRQRAERNFYETARLTILRSRDHSVWRTKNAELRAMGLPMVSAEPAE